MTFRPGSLSAVMRRRVASRCARALTLPTPGRGRSTSGQSRSSLAPGWRRWRARSPAAASGSRRSWARSRRSTRRSARSGRWPRCPTVSPRGRQWRKKGALRGPPSGVRLGASPTGRAGGELPRRGRWSRRPADAGAGDPDRHGQARRIAAGGSARARPWAPWPAGRHGARLLRGQRRADALP